MSRVSAVTARRISAQHLLTVRGTIDFFDEYANFMGDAIGRILTLIENSGTFPGSGPVVCFHNVDLESLDVEIGFVVAQPIDSQGDIQATVLPACMVAIAIDRGPYEKQDATLQDIMKWIAANGYRAEGDIYYHYLNGEEQPQNEFLTEMYVPVGEL